jgi:post-segregation antitoxin (ccd killing protein)
MWGLPILSGLVWTWVWLKRGKILRLPIVYHYDSLVGTILDLFVILLLVITAIVAFVSPPNSNSAMVSDMARVAHWAQNQSLAHYGTGIESQNSHSPGAEMMMLNIYVLGEGDSFVNLIAWLSYAGCVAAAASLAEVFGAKVNGQRMAAIFAATIPAAVAHATSAMNDLVVTLFIVSTVLMVFQYTRKEQKPLTLVLAAVAAALAVATKATAFIFLWSFALYIIIILRQRVGMIKMLLWAVLAFAIMGMVNGGHFYRNQKSYGQFYRPVELTTQMNEARNWRIMVSNITRNAALHADLPVHRADTWLKENLEKLHSMLELDISDPRTTIGDTFYIPQVNTSEMTSGNPVHAAIIVFSITAVVGMVILGKEDPEILIYLGAIFFSMILFCYVLKWQPTGGRFHLPFFFLFSPLVSVLLDKLEKFELETVLAVILLLYALPWLFQTQERPVIPNENRTYQRSVFNDKRERLYFATDPEDYKAYWSITNTIKTLGINQIGLDLTAESEEYPFWAMLGAPDETLHIEWVDTDSASETLLDEEFSPEAVIAEGLSPLEAAQYAESYQQETHFGIDLFIKDDG